MVTEQMGGCHILCYFEELEEIEHLKINAAFLNFLTQNGPYYAGPFNAGPYFRHSQN